MQLSQRQCEILQAIVEDYIASAEPVGSRTVSKKIKNLSSATIRNEMADLEEMGLITQPHLSSGRIPTQKGLRFYINYILALEKLSKEEAELIENIKKEYEQKRKNCKLLFKELSKTISNITEHPSLVIIPKIAFERFKKVQFLLIDDKHLLITLVTTSGMIEQIQHTLDINISQEKLNLLANELNNNSNGFNINDINEALTNLLKNSKSINNKPLVKPLIYLNNIDENIDERIVLSGTENIVKKPEFQNSEKLRMFIEITNDKEKLFKILTDENLTKNFMNDTIVLIGDEIKELKDLNLGLIASEYKDSDNACGILGIIGPYRMEYSKIISLIREFAIKLSEILKNNKI